MGPPVAGTLCSGTKAMHSFCPHCGQCPAEVADGGEGAVHEDIGNDLSTYVSPCSASCCALGAGHSPPSGPHRPSAGSRSSFRVELNDLLRSPCGEQQGWDGIWGASAKSKFTLAVLGHKTQQSPKPLSYSPCVSLRAIDHCSCFS